MVTGIINNIQSLRLKNCRYCNEEFKPMHPAQTCCNKDCYKKYKKEYKRKFDVRRRTENNIYANRWAHNNRLIIGRNRRIRIVKYRNMIFALLGKRCANSNCPIPNEKMDIRALQIDHINGSDTTEKLKYDTEMYHKNILEKIRNGSTEYQLLCAYCNWMKRYEKGEVKSCWTIV